MVQKIIYNQYLKDQITRAESKWGRKHDYDEIFKQQLNLTIDDVEGYIGYPKTICCMGCRTGTEVFEFKERYPEAQVYGVDITDRIETIRSHLAVKITLQDFNNLPLAWADKFDLIYSNSLDHAYEPKDTLKEWHRVASHEGYLLLEFSTTPANGIEHSFKVKDIPKLLSGEQFDKLLIWESPERNIFTGLFKVKK